MISPLHDVTRRYGAHFSPAFFGEETPEHYGDPQAEYGHALENAVVIDASHQGKLELSGPDAPAFLHNLCTNNITGLPLGGGCEAWFCDHRAKAQGHAFIYHVLIENGRHAFKLDMEPGQNEPLLKHLDRHLISEQVEIIDQTPLLAQVHIGGRHARSILAALVPGAIPDLQEFMHMERAIDAEILCQIRRHDSLGLPGYDLLCQNHQAEKLWDRIVAAGAKPAGRTATDVLRMEAGLALYGIDVDADRFVMEVPHALRGVSYNKGCYLGQEPIVMARDRAGFVSRAFLGVKVLHHQTLTPGATLWADKTKVGLVTSSVYSPRLGAPLALAYIQRGFQDPGRRLSVSITSGQIEVEVLPFPPVGSLM